MNWITKLERKFGRYCIPNLISILIGGQILTTTGDSFCGYCYEPGAKIYIYEVVDKRTS